MKSIKSLWELDRIIVKAYFGILLFIQQKSHHRENRMIFTMVDFY